MTHVKPGLKRLRDYPFQRLDALLAGVSPPADLPAMRLSLGEPQQDPPAALVACLRDPERISSSLRRYPKSRGLPHLRQAISRWLARRYQAHADPETSVLPVAGTREALFSIAGAVIGGKTRPLALMPNPFYQIYQGAALLHGAEPHYLAAGRAQGYTPDFEAVPDRIWNRTELLYLCSPGNPTGRVLSPDTQQRLIELAHHFGFVIAADECYSEIYPDESAPPVGLLQVSQAIGNTDHARCLSFNSLSKRSSAPGLRSGFVAGDPALIAAYAQYRTYHGVALPVLAQEASALAWADEAHVRDTRARYRARFDAVVPALSTGFEITAPEGGFFLWLPVAGDDQAFTRALYQHSHVSVLPGSYLSYGDGDDNPGAGHVRIALVASRQTCLEAVERILAFQGLGACGAGS